MPHARHCALPHLILTTAYKIGTVSIPVLQTRNLRLTYLPNGSARSVQELRCKCRPLWGLKYVLLPLSILPPTGFPSTASMLLLSTHMSYWWSPSFPEICIILSAVKCHPATKTQSSWDTEARSKCRISMDIFNNNFSQFWEPSARSRI